MSSYCHSQKILAANDAGGRFLLGYVDRMSGALTLGSFRHDANMCSILQRGSEMETEAQRAIEYLERTLQLRKKARDIFDIKARQALLNEADDFERLAAGITENLVSKR